MAASISRFVLLPSSHARVHVHFDKSATLEHELRAVVRGAVRFDEASRALYPTDASNYRHVPIGRVVARPRAEYAYGLHS